MQHLDRLLNTLRVALPGAVDPVIKLSLANALQELAKDSFVVQEDLTLDLIDGEAEYDLQELTPNEIKWVLAVKVDDLQATAIVAPMGALSATEKTSRWYPVQPSTVMLYPTPAAPLPTIIARVAVVPTSSEDAEVLDNVPDWVFDKFFSCLENGTLARMLSQLAKPYSNPAQALFHLKRFNGLKAEALDTVRHNFTPALGQQWRFPRFA